MLTSTLLLTTISLVSAAPFSFTNNPIGNSFPTPIPSQVPDIEAQAHGSLPNGAPPATVNADTITSLQAIASQEAFEVAYFHSLLENVTNSAPGDGYHFNEPKERSYVIASLTAIQAQEELHFLNANGALAHFKAAPIVPCEYQFPVSTFKDAIALASTFTKVVMGTLQDVEEHFALVGDVGLIRGVASVIGQEGEQNGFFRHFLGKIPSELPFLTTSTREFAFSALNQNFVVPGSCNAANLATINLPIFVPLSVETANIQPIKQDLQFSFEQPADGPKAEWGGNYENLRMAYVNQQNMPQVAQFRSVKVKGNKVTVEVAFDFDEAKFGNGLTIASVVLASGDLSSASGVAKVAVAGPGLIDIN